MTPSRTKVIGLASRLLGSVQLSVTLLVCGVLSLAAGMIIESRLGPEVARATFFRTLGFDLYLLLLVTNLVVAVTRRIPIQRHQWAFVLTHFSMVLVLFGVWTSHTWSDEGRIQVVEGLPSDTFYLNRYEVLLVDLQAAGDADHHYPIPTSPFPVSQVLQRKTEQLPHVEILDRLRHGRVREIPEPASDPQARARGPLTVASSTSGNDEGAGPCLLLRVGDGESAIEFWTTMQGSRRIDLEGRQFDVAFRRPYGRMPFCVALSPTAREGANLTAELAGQLMLTDSSGKTPSLLANLAIDEPLDYMGFKLTQKSFAAAENGQQATATLLVSRDPGMQIIYVAFVLWILGVAWWLFGKGQRHLRRGPLRAVAGRGSAPEAGAEDGNSGLGEFALEPRAPKSRHERPQGVPAK